MSWLDRISEDENTDRSFKPSYDTPLPFDGGDVAAGAQRGGYGLRSALSGAMGDDASARYYGAMASGTPTRFNSYKDVDPLSLDVIDYVQQVGGEQAPNMALMAAGGGVGGAAARSLMGARIGGGLASGAMQYGEMSNELRREGLEPTPVTAGAALLGGALDVIGLESLTKGMLKSAVGEQIKNEVHASAAKRALRGGFGGFLEGVKNELPAELTQEVLAVGNRAYSDPSYLNKTGEIADRFAETAVATTAFAGPLGAAPGAIGGLRANPGSTPEVTPEVTSNVQEPNAPVSPDSSTATAPPSGVDVRTVPSQGESVPPTTEAAPPKEVNPFVDFDGDLRPALNSRGEQIHESPETTTGFWRQFDGSRAVDSQGRPVLLHHGTSKLMVKGQWQDDPPFSEFDPSRSNSASQAGEAVEKPGFWFTNDKGVAQSFGELAASRYSDLAGPEDAYVHDAYLSLKNPRILGDGRRVISQEEITKAAREVADSPNEDGLIVRRGQETYMGRGVADLYMVKDPKQVILKSKLAALDLPARNKDISVLDQIKQAPSHDMSLDELRALDSSTSSGDTHGESQNATQESTLPNENGQRREVLEPAGAKAPAPVSSGRQLTAVNTSLPEEARALLDTIAGTESPGYNTRYGGKTFEGFDDHPRIGQRIERGPNAGKVSKAAGRYQFITGTWDAQAKKLGLKDFSPENQDLAAWDLAEEVYKSKTNRDLLTDLKSTDPQVHANVGKVLADTWTSLPGGIEATTHGSRFSKEFHQNLQRERGAPTTAAPQKQTYTSEQNASEVTEVARRKVAGEPIYQDTALGRAIKGQTETDNEQTGQTYADEGLQFEDTDDGFSLTFKGKKYESTGDDLMRPSRPLPEAAVESDDRFQGLSTESTPVRAFTTMYPEAIVSRSTDPKDFTRKLSVQFPEDQRQALEDDPKKLAGATLKALISGKEDKQEKKILLQHPNVLNGETEKPIEIPLTRSGLAQIGYALNPDLYGNSPASAYDAMVLGMSHMIYDHGFQPRYSKEDLLKQAAGGEKWEGVPVKQGRKPANPVGVWIQEQLGERPEDRTPERVEVDEKTSRTLHPVATQVAVKDGKYYAVDRRKTPLTRDENGKLVSAGNLHAEVPEEGQRRIGSARMEGQLPAPGAEGFTGEDLAPYPEYESKPAHDPLTQRLLSHITTRASMFREAEVKDAQLISTQDLTDEQRIQNWNRAVDRAVRETKPEDIHTAGSSAGTPAIDDAILNRVFDSPEQARQALASVQYQNIPKLHGPRQFIAMKEGNKATFKLTETPEGKYRLMISDKATPEMNRPRVATRKDLIEAGKIAKREFSAALFAKRKAAERDVDLMDAGKDQESLSLREGLTEDQLMATEGSIGVGEDRAAMRERNKNLLRPDQSAKREQLGRDTRASIAEVDKTNAERRVEGETVHKLPGGTVVRASGVSQKVVDFLSTALTDIGLQVPVRAIGKKALGDHVALLEDELREVGERYQMEEAALDSLPGITKAQQAARKKAEQVLAKLGRQSVDIGRELDNLAKAMHEDFVARVIYNDHYQEARVDTDDPYRAAPRRVPIIVVNEELVDGAAPVVEQVKAKPKAKAAKKAPKAKSPYPRGTELTFRDFAGKPFTVKVAGTIEVFGETFVIHRDPDAKKLWVVSDPISGKRAGYKSTLKDAKESIGQELTNFGEARIREILAKARASSDSHNYRGKPGVTPSLARVLGHELGHLVQRAWFDRLPAEQQQEIIKELSEDGVYTDDVAEAFADRFHEFYERTKRGEQIKAKLKTDGLFQRLKNALQRLWNNLVGHDKAFARAYPKFEEFLRSTIGVYGKLDPINPEINKLWIESLAQPYGGLPLRVADGKDFHDMTVDEFNQTVTDAAKQRLDQAQKWASGKPIAQKQVTKDYIARANATLDVLKTGARWLLKAEGDRLRGSFGGLFAGWGNVYAPEMGVERKLARVIDGPLRTNAITGTLRNHTHRIEAKYRVQKENLIERTQTLSKEQTAALRELLRDERPLLEILRERGSQDSPLSRVKDEELRPVANLARDIRSYFWLLRKGLVKAGVLEKEQLKSNYSPKMWGADKFADLKMRDEIISRITKLYEAREELPVQSRERLRVEDAEGNLIRYSWHEKRYTSAKMAATDFYNRIRTGELDAMVDQSSEAIERGLLTSAFAYNKPRPFSEAEYKQFKLYDFLEDDVGYMVNNYTVQAAKRIAQMEATGIPRQDLANKSVRERWETRFLNAGVDTQVMYTPTAALDLLLAEGVQDGRISTKEEYNEAKSLLASSLGMKNVGSNPMARRWVNRIVAFQTFLTMPWSAFAALADFGVTAWRGESFERMTEALGKTFNSLTREKELELLRTLGMAMGEASRSALTSETIMANDPMARGTHRATEWFFHWNGMEYLSRTNMIFASALGQSYIKDYANQAVNGKTEKERADAVKRLRMLHPTLTPHQALTEDFHSSDDMQVALSEFINQAHLHDQHGYTPEIFNDYRFRFFTMLKGFSFKFHNIVLKQLWEKMKDQPDLLRAAVPMVTLAAATMPLALAGMWLKDRLRRDLPAAAGHMIGTNAFDLKRAKDKTPTQILHDVVMASGMPGVYLSLFDDMLEAPQHGQPGLIAIMGPVVGSAYNFSARTLDESVPAMIPGVASVPGFRAAMRSGLRNTFGFGVRDEEE